MGVAIDHAIGDERSSIRSAQRICGDSVTGERNEAGDSKGWDERARRHWRLLRMKNYRQGKPTAGTRRRQKEPVGISPYLIDQGAPTALYTATSAVAAGA